MSKSAINTLTLCSDLCSTDDELNWIWPAVSTSPQPQLLQHYATLSQHVSCLARALTMSMLSNSTENTDTEMQEGIWLA